MRPRLVCRWAAGRKIDKEDKALIPHTFQFVHIAKNIDTKVSISEEYWGIPG